MSESFALLFSSLLDSSVWIGQPHHVVRVWITMLVTKGPDGVVSNTKIGLAHRACVTRAELDDALAVLSAPDAESRSPEHEGRRIEAVPGGWLLLNYLTYRSKQLREQELERKREDARKRRDGAPPSPLLSAIDRYEPPPSATLSVSRSKSGSESSDPEGVQGEPANELAPTPDALPVAAPPMVREPTRKLSRFCPADFEPNDKHRMRCAELKFDVFELLKQFKRYEFQREYSNWDLRFDGWIETAKLQRDAARASPASSTHARASPASESVRVTGWGQHLPADIVDHAKKHELSAHEIAGEMLRAGELDAVTSHSEANRRLAEEVKKRVKARRKPRTEAA